MQRDGNVVLYDHKSRALWATNTSRNVRPRELIMQADGNLVLYDVHGVARWTSGTGGNRNAFLRLLNNGNLVVYRSGARSKTAKYALWTASLQENVRRHWKMLGQQSRKPKGLVSNILAVHNRYRAEVGVPALTWDSRLAASAQRWANYLARTGKFKHSPRGGENLAKGTAGYYSTVELLNMWGDEKKYFIAGRAIPKVSKTGKFEDVGHYTQMTWSTTTKVGGAIARGRGYDVLVCHYNPSGNVIGRKPF